LALETSATGKVVTGQIITKGSAKVTTNGRRLAKLMADLIWTTVWVRGRTLPRFMNDGRELRSASPCSCPRSWLFSNVLVRRIDRRWRIGIVSKRGRGRSREQATTATTAAGEPLAAVAFSVEDMECRQTDLGKFFLA
jgi:hypothetical protein